MRRFTRAALLTSVLVGCLFADAAYLCAQAAHPQVRSGKKGIGTYQHPYVDEDLADLNVAWYYNWGPTPGSIHAPVGMQFVPMIWGSKDLNAKALSAAKASGAGILLGFNEPNEKTQANMTVQQAVDAWPQLEATGLRLGSPAPGTGDDLRPNGWLAQFMAAAQTKRLRIDFICIHPYQRSFDPDQATRDLVREVNAVHDLYHRPIWVTEYAMVKWHDTHGETPDYAKQAEFARKSAAALEKIPFVERYAWYTTIPGQPTFSAFTAEGKETPVGTAWKLAP